MGNVMLMHAGKRFAIFEDVIELDKGKYLDCLLLNSIDPLKDKPCIHLQKTVGTPDNLSYVRGGLVIEVERLQELKAVIDQMYMTAIKFNLV